MLRVEDIVRSIILERHIGPLREGDNPNGVQFDREFDSDEGSRTNEPRLYFGQGISLCIVSGEELYFGVNNPTIDSAVETAIKYI
jgi:hypothetical protein